MIPLIHPATEEEVKSIADHADLTPNCRVWGWEGSLVVLRKCLEIDPLFFTPGASARHKTMFAWAVFNALLAQGETEVYFDVDAEGQDEWIKLLEGMGAKKTTSTPQWRFKMELK